MLALTCVEAAQVEPQAVAEGAARRGWVKADRTAHEDSQAVASVVQRLEAKIAAAVHRAWVEWVVKVRVEAQEVASVVLHQAPVALRAARHGCVALHPTAHLEVRDSVACHQELEDSEEARRGCVMVDRKVQAVVSVVQRWEARIAAAVHRAWVGWVVTVRVAAQAVASVALPRAPVAPRVARRGCVALDPTAHSEVQGLEALGLVAFRCQDLDLEEEGCHGIAPPQHGDLALAGPGRRR